MPGLGLGLGLNKLPEGVAFDVDAQVYFDAVDAAGGSLTSAEKTAVNIYIVDAKGNVNAWWDDFLAWYPMVGANASGFGVNAKTPGTFNGTFVNTVAGDFTSTGWTPNGANSYMDTNIIPITDTILNNFAGAYYSRDSRAGGNIYFWGAFNSNAQRLNLIPRDAANNLRNDFYNNSTGQGRMDRANTITQAEVIVSRTASNDLRAYVNGAQIGATHITAGGSRPTVNLFVAALNSGGAPAAFESNECAGVWLGATMTVAKVLAQFNAIQTMNTTLNRQV